MGDVEPRISDLILKHLPDLPASIGVVGGEPAEAYSTHLESAGYQVFRYFFSDPPTHPSLETGHGGIGCRRNDFPGHEKLDGMATQCDAILFCGFSNGVDPLMRAFNGVRGLLREKGVVLICHEMKDAPLIGEDPGTQRQNDVISALYEFGFGVRCNEWIGVNARSSRDPERPSKTGCHVVVGKKDRVFVRGYREGDETDILTMFTEVFKVDRTLEHWYWKFRDNPFGAYRIAEAFGADGTLAGHYSGYPVPFYAPARGGSEFLSYQIGDIMTRPGFRQVGLANTSILGRMTDYFHHRFCISAVPFMYGFITGNHKRFGERFLGYSYLHQIPYHVLNIAGLRLNVKGRAAAFLSGFSVKPVAHMRPEFDVFFQQVSEGYGLLVKRDAAYLKWRYLDCPDHRHTLFAVRRLGRLAGWSAFSRRGGALIWGDALFRKTTDVRTVRVMLDYVLAHYFPGVARIEAWFSPEPQWWTALLRDVGFRATDEPNKLVAGVTIFDRSFSLEWIQRNLYYAMGDSDLF